HVLPPGAKADEEQLLKIVADQVAIAAENARLYEGVMRRAAEQESLVESGRLLTGTLQVSEVLSRLSELVRSRFGADVARILIISEDTPSVFRLHAQAGATRTARETVQHDVGDDDGLIGWIAKHRRPLAYSDVLTEPRVKRRQWLESEGVVSVLGLPLFLESELVGVLNILYRTRHVFTPEELALGEALATSASVAIRNARLHEQTEERLRHTEGPVYASHSQDDPRFTHPIARLLPHKSVLIQPMRWKGVAIGGFALAWLREHHRFTSEELGLAEGIALQAAVASENSRLYEGVKQQMAELKRTQAQLIQSTKLAAIGELAANIAHE